MTIKTFTPASIASWESTLAVRTELCLSVAGINGSKLTLYAGPGAKGSEPVAILTGLNGGTYISRARASDIEHWVAAMLQTAKEFIHPANSHSGGGR
jgi:hypothetical protein